MSVLTTTNKVSYDCDGAQKDFDFSFSIIGTDTSVIKVSVLNTVTGHPTELTEESGAYSYSVSAPNNNYANGGTVSTTKLEGAAYVAYAWSSDYKITISRTVPYTQPTDFKEGGLDPNKLEQTVDHLCFQSQQLEERAERTVHGPVSDPATTSYEMPGKVARASKVLGCDAEGNIIALSNVPTSGVPATAYMQTLLDDANAAIAQATLKLKDYSASLGLSDLISKGPCLDVRAFLPSGFVTDGSVAYTTEFQTAMTTADTEERALHVPAGKWKMATNALTYGSTYSDTRKGLVMFGDGRKTEIIQTTADVDLFKIGDRNSAYALNEVIIANMHIGTVNGTGSALVLDRCCRFVVRNITSLGAGKYMLHLYGTLIGAVENVIGSVNLRPPFYAGVNTATMDAWVRVESDVLPVEETLAPNAIVWNNLILEASAHGKGMHITDAPSQTFVGGVIETFNSDYALYAVRCDGLNAQGLHIEHNSDSYGTYLEDLQGGRLNLVNVKSPIELLDCFGTEISGRFTGDAVDTLTIGKDCRSCVVDKLVFQQVNFLRNSSRTTIVRDTSELRALGEELDYGFGTAPRSHQLLDGGVQTWDGNTSLELVVRGTPTVAREDTVILMGSHSAKITSSDWAHGLGPEVPPIYNDTWISVEAWVRVVSGTAGIWLAGESGDGDGHLTITAVAGTWAKIEAKCFWEGSVDSKIVFSTAVNGVEAVFYLGAVNVWSESDPNPVIHTLADEATPSVETTQKHSYWLTGGTANDPFTDFADGRAGQVITIIAEHSVTVTDGTNIFLNGSANFDMTATDTLTLICKADNKWYELSRSDNT